MRVTAFNIGRRFVVFTGALLIMAGLFAIAGISSASAQAQPKTGAPSSASLPVAEPQAAATCVPNYVIAQATVTSYPTGTALVAGSRCDDCVFDISLPFAYTLYGHSSTTAFGSSNGQIDFVGPGDRSFVNNCLPDINTSYAIFPHWLDLTTDINNAFCTGCGVYTSVSGSSPMRIFNIEYRALDWISNQPVRFIVRLYEGQQRFDIIYTALDATDSPQSTIGVQSGDGTVSQYQCPGSPGTLVVNTILTFTLTGSTCSTGTPTTPATNTAVPTLTYTPVATGTPTATRTRTGTPAATATSTPSPTRTSSATSTSVSTLTPTRSATATVTRTRTATATATATRVIDGHVTWGGRVPQPSQYQEAPISLTLRPAGGGALIEFATRNTDANGHFMVDVTSVPNGTYTWRVKNPLYLASAGTMVLVGSPVTAVEMGIMRGGDGNDDNSVNSPDFNIERTSFGTMCGNPEFDPRGDFTGDCLVDIRDFNILRNNFGVSGAP